MCLGVPGQILRVHPADHGAESLASVDFQGSQVEVSLSLVPGAKPGDWVLVHAGYALTLLDQAEAAETWRWLEMAEVARELGRASAAPAAPEARP
ncbi:MAG TPA: HypC/HybG/HupF family hydrogenase formation chaperone [bacterium]|jgi:hydrogenase expression/formation protein HypC|nr:HypC/HybG/HupF family hydrogenase formation chaperone [bacterium]